MLRRGGCLVGVIALVFGAVGLPVRADARPKEGEVVLRGTGAAHGLGMAMDGVEGQARAGWTHDRILDLFYPGTTSGRAGGTIRVGLAEAPVVSLSLPNGGVVSDAARGTTAGAGFPVTLAPGASVTLRLGPDGITTTLPAAAPRPTPSPAEPEPEQSSTDNPLVPTPPPPPVVQPTPTPAPNRPTPGAEPSSGAAGGPRTAPKRVFVWGTGDPALVSVAATEHAYRGLVEVVPRGGKLTVVNHVDLETYVAGIAEEKGAGWPLEGLKTLAIAARTLGAATMSWYAKNQGNGYDICPTDSCQVYLGYDGEEPVMRRATAETAGVIRTYNGRPILAMYHGNGGGQTESYKRLIDYPGDPHPYLKSVRYPYADPSHWKRRESYASMDASLRAAGVAIPGQLESIEITERGDSPRVVHMRLRGEDGAVTITGQRFADALDLWSTWFDIETGSPGTATVVVTQADVGFPLAAAPDESRPATQHSWLPLVIAVLALVALASATGLLARELPVGSFGVPPGRVRGALLYGSDAAG
jgi:SpoIID/LytB domain protein